jgi:hypothetical protein
MAKDNTYYATLSIKDFSINLYTTKNQVANQVKCHRNYLNNISDRITYGDYIIIPVTLTKCNRHKTKHNES